MVAARQGETMRRSRNYPVFLKLQGKHVLVIGGGTVAAQKVGKLLESGAKITVVSPDATETLRRWAKKQRLRWLRRAFHFSDVRSASLVFAATADPVLNGQVVQAARKHRIWVNAVDMPSLCDFFSPSIASQGNISLAISTGGSSPALAKYLRKQLGIWLQPGWGKLATLLEQFRPQLLRLDKHRKERILGNVLTPNFLKLINQRGIKAAKTELQNILSKL
jgi:siroheme synthase-like protein